MKEINRRSFVQGMLLSGAYATIAPVSKFYTKNDSQRAMSTIFQDQHKWHCGHYLFVAQYLGDWIQNHPNGQELIAALQKLNCSCGKEITKYFLDRDSYSPEPVYNKPETEEERIKSVDQDFSDLIWERAQYYIKTKGYSPPFPEGDSPIDIAFDLYKKEKSWIKDWSFHIFFDYLGCETTLDDFIFHSCWKYQCQIPNSYGQKNPDRFYSLLKEVKKIARDHSDGRTEAIVRQAIGEISPNDILSYLAFESGGTIGLLDDFPKEGPPSKSFALHILRKHLQSGVNPFSAIVGLSLLRDENSYAKLFEWWEGREFKTYAEALSCACGLVYLNYNLGLPYFRKIAFLPTLTLHDIDDGHYITVPDRAIDARIDFYPAAFDTPFPYWTDNVHEGLKHLTESELRRGWTQTNSYECKIEAAIELANRPQAKKYATIINQALSDANHFDAVRLINSTMQTAPKLACYLGQRALNHSHWEVRLAAAIAMLRQDMESA